jgi:hypothetical protein
MGHQPAFFTTTLTDVQARFTKWRETRPHKGRIPEDLWAAAVLLSNEHSIHRISRALRLSYSDLKARVEKSHTSSAAIKSSASLDFIPIDIVSTQPAECIVEMEHRNGNRMRMHFKGKLDLDLQAFAESFWSGKG